MAYSAVENRALQLNPNNWRYWRSRGYDEIPGSTGCIDHICLRIIKFPFTVVKGILSFIFRLISPILKLFLLLVTSCTVWILIIIAVLVYYLYYHFFNCHGQIYRFVFNNCTTPTVNLPLLPVNITKPALPTVEDFPFLGKILSAIQNITKTH